MRGFGLLSWRDNRVLAGSHRQLLVVPSSDDDNHLEVIEFVESRVTNALLDDATVMI